MGNLRPLLTAMIVAGLFPAVLSPFRGALADPAPNVSFSAPGLLEKKPASTAPVARARPLAWPRLDPGAVLCRTEADLAQVAANRSGEGDGGAANCQIIRVATPVTIVQRSGPGRTQVMTGTQSGWTDVWLPEKAPAGAAVR